MGHDEQHCFKRNHSEKSATNTAAKPTTESSSGDAGSSSSKNAYPIMDLQEKQNQTSEGKFLSVDDDSKVACNVISEGRLKAMHALADSGCPVSLIKQSYFDQSFQFSRASDTDLVGVNDSKIEIVEAYSTSIIIDTNVYIANFAVASDKTMKVDVILGRRFLQENDFVGLKFKRDCKFDVEAMKNVLDSDVSDASILFADDKIELDIGDSNETRALSGKVYELFTRDYLNRVKPSEPLIRYTVEIKLKEDRYFNATPLRLSDFERKEQNKIILDMLSRGIIRESESPYSSDYQIRPSDRHIVNVNNIPFPTNDKSSQRFLGLMSYFRKFIFRYNQIANPLYELMNRRGSQFKFEPKHFESFNKLKNALISKPVLSIYNPRAETQLHTDASSSGYGGILMQRQTCDNQFHPVMCFLAQNIGG